MRIAVLFFGQPRFFDITAHIFKKYFQQISHPVSGREYHIPHTSNKSFCQYSVDYFAHLWDSISYAPNNPEDEINTDKLINILEKDLAVKDYCIESTSVLDTFGDNIFKFHRFFDNIFNDKQHRGLSHYTQMSSHYATGQYYSFGEVYNLMEAYERKHEFKYDVVIRLRTDYLVNGMDIHDLITFKSYSYPMLKVAEQKTSKEVSDKIQKSLEPDRDGMTWLGLARVKDHFWCYNRLGAELFIEKYFMYYFLVKLHDRLNIPLPLSFPLQDEFTLTSRFRYHSCEKLYILISSMTGAEIELIDYHIARVCHPTTKSKYRNSVVIPRYKGCNEAITGPLLTDYISFNNDNKAIANDLDVWVEEYLKKLQQYLSSRKYFYRKKEEHEHKYETFCYDI